MQVFAVVGACALCALLGFVAGCLAALYDHVEIRRYRASQCSDRDADRCEHYPANYAERAA